MKKIDNVEFRYDPTVMFTADDTWLMAREPVLRRMPDGSLVSLIYTGGPTEPHPDNLVAIIRSTDDGASWSRPEVLFRHPRRSSWGTELFTDGGKPFAIFQTYNVDTLYQELRAYVSSTSDSGKSWSDPVGIPGVPANFCVRQGRILSDGSWLFPVYWQEVRDNWQGSFVDGNWDRRWCFVSGVIRSTDQGKSWSLHGNCTTGAASHAWEPEVIEVSPGHLRMFIRCESPEHRLWESESYDYGLSWSQPVPGEISNPGTKLVVYRVRDCWVMLNNCCTNEKPDRSSLVLLTSYDGKHWREKMEIARLTDAAPLPQIAYPHGFADDERQTLYLALDAIRKFFMVKIPYADILEP